MTMIKVLWCRFQQWLVTFTMLLFEVSSETGLFRHLSDYVFRVRNFENTKSTRVIIFPKFNLDFKNAAQNLEKMFCFWGNCIRIDIVKVSLLRTRKSASNVLTSSHKIWHVNRRDLFRLSWLAVSNKYDKSAKMLTLTVLGHVYYVAFQGIIWNGTSYTFIWLRFWSP